MTTDRTYEIYCCWRRHGSFAAAGLELGVCREHVRQSTRRVERSLSRQKRRGEMARRAGHPTSIVSAEDNNDIASLPKKMRRAARQAWLEGWMGPPDMERAGA